MSKYYLPRKYSGFPSSSKLDSVALLKNQKRVVTYRNDPMKYVDKEKKKKRRKHKIKIISGIHLLL
ncbi:hypothetical protein JTP64_000456 [Candida tropicalis]|nr:hypothetical protein JTP64_000456 [Candida tropicalis]